MNVLKINKILANRSRLNILQWLKDPERNFPPHNELGHFDFGVCVQYIKNKSGLSDSTTSHYLSKMEQAGLVIATRFGKWTYYKRNEIVIREYMQKLNSELKLDDSSKID